MRTAFIVLALLFSGWVAADEARPVYVEVEENSASQFLVKWKVPPVMPAGQEPYIKLQHPDCQLVDVWLLRHSSSQWSALLVPVQQSVLQHSSAQCGGVSTSVDATAGRLSCDCGGDG